MASPQRRVYQHRRRQAAQGFKRLEVTVPVEDAVLVRALATQLRTGGPVAQQVRHQLLPLLAEHTSGADLVAFFRSSPLSGAELMIERDPSTGRDVEF